MKSAVLLLALVVSVMFPVVGAGQQSAGLEPMEALPEHLIYLYSGTLERTPTEAERQLFAAARRWEIGRVLKVCAFGGNEVVAALVRQAASEWNQYSSVKFDFGTAAAGFNCLDPRGGHFQVRIGFSDRGYWSVLGNDSEVRLDPLAPSMNLEGFNRLYSPARMSSSAVLAQADRYHVATIKHEFGHALGLLHEHQQPALNCYAEIKWDGPNNVFDYFALIGWTRDMVERNLGYIAQTDPDYVAGDSDPKSIMMYSLPAQVFRQPDSKCRVDRNYEISPKDKQVVARVYPSRPPAMNAALSDFDLSSAKVRPAASPTTANEIQDVKERVLADLQSDDAMVRRNARVRLADALPKLPPSDATELIQRARTGSYRLQLGLAVGINNAASAFKLTPEAKAVLAERAKTAADATLRTELGKAAAR